MVPKTADVLICGHYWSDEAEKETNTDTSLYTTSAVISRLNADGKVDLFLNIAGKNPVSGKTSQDECWGILPTT